MSQGVQIGPLLLPAGVLVVALSVVIALLVGNRLARKAGVELESRLYTILFVGLACARLAFVLQHHDSYASAPWSVLDIRDGGWSAWAGLLGAWLYALALVVRLPAIRRPLLSALIASSAVWVAAMVLMALPPREAQRLPDFAALSLQGGPIPLPSYTGKPTVINLWASWCPPCRREMPVFERVQNERADVNVVFLNQGEAPSTVQQFLTANKLTLRNVLLDANGDVARSLGHRGLPVTLFFDAAGRLVDTRIGELSYATLVQRIGSIPPPPSASN